MDITNSKKKIKCQAKGCNKKANYRVYKNGNEGHFCGWCASDVKNGHSNVEELKGDKNE